MPVKDSYDGKRRAGEENQHTSHELEGLGLDGLIGVGIWDLGRHGGWFANAIDRVLDVGGAGSCSSLVWWSFRQGLRRLV